MEHGCSIRRRAPEFDPRMRPRPRKTDVRRDDSWHNPLNGGRSFLGFHLEVPEVKIGARGIKGFITLAKTKSSTPRADP